MQILNQTVKEGDVWYYPPLELRVSVAGVSAFTAAETWCGIVRNEYKRQESDREWKSIESAKESKSRDAPAVDSGQEVAATRESGRGEVTATEIISDAEASLEAILEAKLALLKQRLTTVRESYTVYNTQAYEAECEIAEIKREITAVAAAMEVACGTRADDDEVGVDIYRQVPDDRQEGSGEVGDSDDTEEAPQEASGEGEGTS